MAWLTPRVPNELSKMPLSVQLEDVMDKISKGVVPDFYQYSEEVWARALVTMGETESDSKEEDGATLKRVATKKRKFEALDAPQSAPAEEGEIKDQEVDAMEGITMAGH